MKAPCESFGDFFFFFLYLTWVGVVVVGGYNLTRYPVFPAGTEIRRVIGLCIERSGSASPSSTSLESSTPSAPSNSPIGHLKIAQLHTVFHLCVFNFFCSPCCSPRDAVQFLFLALGSVNKTAQPYLAIPKCMQFFFCYLLGCSGQNQVAAIVWRFCAVRSEGLANGSAAERHDQHDVLKVIMVASLSGAYIGILWFHFKT